MRRFRRHTRFRGRFHLGPREREIVANTQREIIRQHAKSMLRERIAVLRLDDGRQTPWRGHPVFIAQHACAACCRNCLRMWHRIPPRKELSDAELDDIVDLILAWIDEQAWKNTKECKCKTCLVGATPKMRTIDDLWKKNSTA